jgi:hypothetical protein
VRDRVTHDEKIFDRLDAIFFLRDGRLATPNFAAVETAFPANITVSALREALMTTSPCNS